MIENFDELIAPISKADFLDNYFERKVLHIANHDPKTVRSLFSRNDAELIMRQHGTKLQKFMRIATKGMIVLPRQTGSVKSALAWIFDEHKKGATIILDYLQRYSLPITRIVRNLAADWGCNFDVSAFLTPGNSPGIRPHCDQMDVFILQIDGCKKWRIYGEAGAFFSIDQESLAEPTHEISLQAGEVLYIPRGFIHQGRTEERASLSLSIVMANPTRWIDLLKTALDVIAQTDVDLRRTMPLNQRQAPDSKTVEELFSALLKHFQNKELLQEALTVSKRNLIVNMKGLPGSQFDSYDVSETLEIHDFVKKFPGMPCYLYSGNGVGDNVSFCFPGCAIDHLNRKLQPALQFIANTTDAFCIAELPGGLPEQTKLILIKRLLREGLLKRVDKLSPYPNPAFQAVA